MYDPLLVNLCAFPAQLHFPSLPLTHYIPFSLLSSLSPTFSFLLPLIHPTSPSFLLFSLPLSPPFPFLLPLLHPLLPLLFFSSLSFLFPLRSLSPTPSPSPSTSYFLLFSLSLSPPFPFLLPLLHAPFLLLFFSSLSLPFP